MVIVELADGRILEYPKATRFERYGGQTNIYSDKILKKKRRGIRYKKGKPYVITETYEERKSRLLARYHGGLRRVEYKGVSRQVKGPTPLATAVKK